MSTISAVIETKSLGAKLSSLTKKDGFKLLSDSILVFLCRAGGAGLTFLVQILLARWMGAEQLGIYVFALAIYLVLTQLATLGYSAATFRFVGQYLAKGELGLIRGYIRQGYCVTLILSLLIMAVSVPVLWYFEGLVPEEQRVPLLIFLLGTPVMALMQQSHGTAHVHGWLKTRFLPDVLQPLIFLLSVAAIFASGVELTATHVVSLHVMIVSLVAITQYVFLRWHMGDRLAAVKPVYRSQEWRRVAPQIMVSILFTIFFPQLFLIVVGLYVPNDELAVFNSSYRIALLIEFGLTAVFAVVLPKISPAIANQDTSAAQHQVSNATLLMFWATLYSVTLLAFFGENILGFLGEEFVVGYPALLVFSAVQLVNASIGPVAGLLGNFGYQDRLLLVFACAFVLTLALSAVLIPAMGITGAALCVLAMTVFSTLWMYWLVARHLGIRPSMLTATIRVFRNV